MTSPQPLGHAALGEIIQANAAKLLLPVELIRAIVRVESTEDAWAFKPEPAYRYLWNVKADRPFRKLTMAEVGSMTPPADFPCLGGSPLQEWWGQRMSFGPMQIMGAVARELGFKGVFLTALCDPATGIGYGCQHLDRLRSRYYHDSGWAAVVASYNAGSPRPADDGRTYVNQGYVDKVLYNLGGKWPA